MRVPAAHFHDGDRALLGDLDAGDETLDLLHQGLGLLAIAEFVDVFHVAAPLLAAEPRSSASSV